MRVVEHPYLKGVLCREDGACFIPASGSHKAHWTFGTVTKGYREVQIGRKRYKVHRLVCETFHGLCPPDKTEVDHFPDRNPSNNAADNLRWVDHCENCRNRKTCIKGMEDAVSQYADMRAYKRARYALDPEYREKCKARNRAYLAKKKADKA